MNEKDTIYRFMKANNKVRLDNKGGNVRFDDLIMKRYGWNVSRNGKVNYQNRITYSKKDNNK